MVTMYNDNYVHIKMCTTKWIIDFIVGLPFLMLLFQRYSILIGYIVHLIRLSILLLFTTNLFNLMMSMINVKTNQIQFKKRNQLDYKEKKHCYNRLLSIDLSILYLFCIINVLFGLFQTNFPHLAFIFQLYYVAMKKKHYKLEWINILYFIYVNESH